LFGVRQNLVFGKETVAIIAAGLKNMFDRCTNTGRSIPTH
jgi:hypothetical protein